MRKLIIVVASLLVVVLLILQGFQQTYPLPEPENNRTSTATGEGIEDAMDAIYFDVTILGVKKATLEGLQSDFGVETSCLSAAYGRYTDGRFGIADVIMVVPKPGQETAARDLLLTIRNSRTALFTNYDIYGASELAENGVIYTLGDYYVLLMIKDADHVRELLEQYLPQGRGETVLCYEETDSTNTRGMQLALEGAPTGTVVLADRQTRGSGRLGRSFLSPGGQGVYLSYLYRPDCDPAALSLLTSCAGLAVCQVLEELGLAPAIKWPNDIIIDRRKVCGLSLIHL